MKNTLLGLCMSLFISSPSATIAATDYAGKKILYIDSYHAGFAWSDGIANGVREVVGKTAADLKIIHMDSKRNNSETFIKSAVDKARSVIDDFKPDVVIASDDNASKFLIAPFFRDSDLPVVFCGVNWDASVYGFPTENITGMVEVTLVPQIVRYLNKYASGSSIGFIAADKLSARKEYRYHRELLDIEYSKAYFAKDFRQWQEMFVKLQQEVDMVILLNHVGIANWNADEAKAFVEQTIRIPVGTRNAWDMPYSVVGVINVPDEQGAWAARAALKILQGVSPGKIPLTRNKQGKLYFNPKLGKKLGISTAPPFAILSQ